MFDKLAKKKVEKISEMTKNKCKGCLVWFGSFFLCTLIIVSKESLETNMLVKKNKGEKRTRKR